MTQPVYRHAGIITIFLSAVLYISLAATPLYAGTVTIAVPPGTLAEIIHD